MSRKDKFYDAVKHALEKDGWLTTHDPFTTQIIESVKLKIDLGAENAIAAQRNQEKIAIEIKSFITDSDISEFHGALGQYLNYVQALEDKEPYLRILEPCRYMAMPCTTHNGKIWSTPDLVEIRSY